MADDFRPPSRFHPVSIFASEVHAAVRLSLLPAPSDRQVHREYFHSLPRHHLSWVSALPHWFCPWSSPLPAGFGVFGHGAVTMPWQVFGEETKSEAPFDPFVRLANQHTACWWKSIQRAFNQISSCIDCKRSLPLQLQWRCRDGTVLRCLQSVLATFSECNLFNHGRKRLHQKFRGVSTVLFSGSLYCALCKLMFYKWRGLVYSPYIVRFDI